jgi:hypothetical protein
LYENRNDDKHKTYLDDFAKNPRSGGRDLTSYISEQIREDLEGKEYVLVRSGIVEGTYSPGRIHIAPLRRRTDINYTPYQPSHVEVALELVAAYWETWDREMKVFREGLWADHLFFLTGAVDQKSFKDFLQQLRESGQGYHRSRKPMVVRGIDADAEFKSIPLKDPPTEMQFLQRFNMAMVGMCAIYQVDPSAVFHGSFQGGGDIPEVDLEDTEGSEGTETENDDTSDDTGTNDDETMNEAFVTKLLNEKTKEHENQIKKINEIFDSIENVESRPKLIINDEITSMLNELKNRK